MDLGDRSSWYCLLDEVGEVLLEQKLPTTPKAMREVFGSMPRCRIALETGMHSPWVSRLLSELGHEVIVAHARKVLVVVGESRRKTIGWMRGRWRGCRAHRSAVAVPGEASQCKAQADLTVIRARAGALVRARTALVNTARELAQSYGERLRGCNVCNMNPEKAQGLSPELQRALEPLLAGIESLSVRIPASATNGLKSCAQESYPRVALLKQIKGVGTLIALTFMLTLEDPASLWQEPRCGLLPGAAAGAKELRPERAADAYQQRRRSLSVNVVGAGVRTTF